MKTKLSRIFGVAVTVAVLASMLVVATPASAGTLAWGSESALPTKSGQDVISVVAAGNGTTVYAVLAANAGGPFDYSAGLSTSLPGVQSLVKSTNGGATWAAVNNGATSTGVVLVAVAPDLADGSFVAAVDAAQNVVISGDGGASWATSTPPAGGFVAITSIAVSKPVGTTRTIAVTDGNAVYTLDLGGLFGGSWVPVTTASATISTANLTSEPMTAVQFSPNYPGDRTLVVMSNGGTNPRLQMYNTASKAWNGQVYPGWAAGILVTPAGAAGVALTLASGYVGSDPASRVAYVGGIGGLVRVSDTNPVSLYNAAAVNSIALNAAGDKLVAGGADNSVLRIASPATATSAGVILATKRPAASTSTLPEVAYAGTAVLAGTSGTESAFSKSTDDGKTFIDISLIDTTITGTAKDFGVSNDGAKIYIANIANSTLSIFRKATAWERTLAIATSATAAVVRVSPDNGDVVYVAETLGNLIYYTNDGGYTTWTQRYSPNVITDLAVESASVVYVLTGGSVSKSVDSGFLWDNPKTATGIAAGNSLTLLGAGNLLVGGTGGEVAYSSDNNVSWTKVAVNVPSGAVVATADKLATGGVIYAASNPTLQGTSGIYRWTIGTSTVWTSLLGTGFVAGGVTGLGLTSGALYATSFNSADNTSMLYRSISPAVGTATGVGATEISGATTYNLAFSDAPQALDLSVGADKFPKVWALSLGSPSALNAGTTALESFTDILVTSSPALSAPVERASVQINTANGQANNVVLMWNAVAGTPVVGTTYDVQVALDSAFTQPLTFTAGTGTAVTTTLLIVGPTGTAQFPFQANTTYYWRVRVHDPLLSPYSAGRSFVIAPLLPIAIQSPANGANNIPLTPTFVWQPVVGATTYELVVSDDPTFKIITFSRTSTQPVFATDEALAYGTVYYWRVRASAPATAVTDWVTGVFTTVGKPAPTTTGSTGPVITITQPAPTTITVEVPQTVSAIPAYLLWIIIGIGAILVIALIVLIVRTRRVS